MDSSRKCSLTGTITPTFAIRSVRPSSRGPTQAPALCAYERERKNTCSPRTILCEILPGKFAPAGLQPRRIVLPPVQQPAYVIAVHLLIRLAGSQVSLTQPDLDLHIMRCLCRQHLEASDCLFGIASPERNVGQTFVCLQLTGRDGQGLAEPLLCFVIRAGPGKAVTQAVEGRRLFGSNRRMAKKSSRASSYLCRQARTCPRASRACLLSGSRRRIVL